MKITRSVENRSRTNLDTTYRGHVAMWYEHGIELLTINGTEDEKVYYSITFLKEEVSRIVRIVVAGYEKEKEEQARYEKVRYEKAQKESPT